MASTLLPPQLVTGARLLLLCYVPADPKAAAALLPAPLKPAKNKAIFLNQYVVDKAEYTSGFGAYSLTYAGPELDGLNADRITQGRYWTHYLNSSAAMRAYAKERGVPATPGKTTLVQRGKRIVATTFDKGKPIIRTTVEVGKKLLPAHGQLRYFSNIGNTFLDGRYPYVLPAADPLKVIAVEFLDPKHSIYALRPASPFKLTAGIYTPSGAFCYPGGQDVWTPK